MISPSPAFGRLEVVPDLHSIQEKVRRGRGWQLQRRRCGRGILPPCWLGFTRTNRCPPRPALPPTPTPQCTQVYDQPTVLLVREVSGEEEVPEGVVGVIRCEPLVALGRAQEACWPCGAGPARLAALLPPACLQPFHVYLSLLMPS